MAEKRARADARDLALAELRRIVAARIAAIDPATLTVAELVELARRLPAPAKTRAAARTHLAAARTRRSDP